MTKETTPIYSGSDEMKTVVTQMEMTKGLDFVCFEREERPNKGFAFFFIFYREIAVHIQG